jgi:hypothetical protein
MRCTQKQWNEWEIEQVDIHSTQMIFGNYYPNQLPVAQNWNQIQAPIRNTIFFIKKQTYSAWFPLKKTDISI